MAVALASVSVLAGALVWLAKSFMRVFVEEIRGLRKDLQGHSRSLVAMKDSLDELVHRTPDSRSSRPSSAT